ncbi:MAG TPA: autotransporter outer membrane beta-barrel domain-containing protein [Candidatus Anaerobiospirillum stercoravium]|nr:autotransporter outer membrane beta-barrel domain-containing protein [Candidatus Anaerobiospirillum stercoravium]
MKLSHNALNFLLAQYRAIFKRTYVKGLAAAVIMTAGMASGSAQAAPNYYFWDYSSAWTNKTDAEASDGLVAGVIGGNNVGSHTETVVSGGNLTIGGSSSSALSGVTSGSAVAGWGSAETGDLTVQNNTITITGAGTVTKDEKDGRGFVYGGWVQSLAGKAAANDNHVIISGKTDDAAAASEGLLGAYVEGHLGASAVSNTIVVSGSSSSSLQKISTSGTSTAIGAQITPIKLGQVTATGEFTANQNQVSLDYVTVSTNAQKDVVNIFGANFNMTNADATKSTLNAQGNIVTLNNAEIDTASGSIGNILGATHAETFGGNINFNANEVKLLDTSFTASGSMTLVGANINGSGIINASGNSVTLDTVAFESEVEQDNPKGNVAGTLIQGTSTKIVATNNQAQILDSTALNVDAVAGAYINNTNNSAKVALTVTDNHVEIGADTNVTAPNVAGAVVVVSGSQLDSLNADGNSVTIAGTVSGDVKAVVLTPTDNTVNANAQLSFLNNKVTLQNGGEIQSGSITGGAGKNSIAEIESGSTYIANKTTQDIASDVINIAGEIHVENGKVLDISGFYKDGLSSATSYNANLTTVADTATIVNSGTINVYGKMVVEDGATLTAGVDKAAIIINGDPDHKSGVVLPAGQAVEGAGFGHLVIAKDTLQSYLNTDGTNAIDDDALSGSLILSEATLEFSGNEEIDLATDFKLSGGAANASGSGVITVSGSTIKAENLAVSKALTQVQKTHGLKLEADTLSLGNNQLDSSSPVDFGFAAATAKDLEVAASGGTLVLANDITLEAVTLEEESDSNNVYAQDNGTITGNLTLSGGDLTIAHGSYTNNYVLNVADGRLSIGGESRYAANGDLVAADLTLRNLVVGANGKVSVNANGSLNLTTIDASAAGDSSIYIHTGDMTIDGAVTTTGSGNNADTDYGIKFATNSVKLDDGATLTLGQAATSAIQVSTTADPNAAAGENKYVTIDSESYAGKVFTVGAGSTVFFSFGTEEQNQVFTTEAISEFRSSLFNDINSDGVIEGFINLGHAEIQGLDIKGDSVEWDKLAPYADIIADITTIDLANAKVTGIESADQVRGNFGSLDGTGIVTVVGNLTLNNADGNNNLFVSDANGNVGSLNVDESATVVLNNGGAIKDITFNKSGHLFVNSVESSESAGTTIEDIAADKATATFGSASGSFGQTVVTGKTDVAQLNTEAGSETTFQGEVTVGAATRTAGTSTLAGTTNFKADATFANDAELSGTANFEQDANFSGDVVILGNTTVKAPTSAAANTSVATFGQDVTVAGAGTFSADSVVMTAAAQGTAPSIFSVGVDTTGTAQDTPSGTGYIEVGNFTLAGNDLVIDPAYTEKTSIAAIRGFGDDRNNKVDAGTVSGRIFVGMNAALDVGTDASIDHMAEFISQYQNADGALERTNVGAVMYLSDELTVANGSRVILDSQRSSSDILAQANLGASGYGDGSRAADLYLGQNTILAVGDGILEDGAAIHFESPDAGIMAQNQSAKIVLDGDKFLNSRNIVLFTDEGGANADGVRILGDHDIRVESLNGLMYFELTAGDTNAKGGTLKLDNTKIDSAFSDATSVGRDMLLAYAARTVNYGEYYSQANQDKIAAGDPTAVDREVLVAGVAAASEAVLESDGTTITVNDPSLSVDDFTIIPVDNGSGATTPVLYRLAHNDLLESMGRNSTGRDFDSVAELGVFAGSAQAALLVAQTSQDAVAGRTGIGATASALTFADNGQGAGLWINPIYISQDSDGFGVDNKDYGVDIDLYGVALGGDYTLANGIRLGAFFNLGSGDSEGNGQASQVSSDFDYWGLGLYAGYSMGAFSVVGDFSYSVVDTDADAGTQVGTISSSYDTDIISVGVTGQYEFEVAGAQITPHAGLRYSTISIDDFDLTASGYQDGGHFDSDRMNVFSIPVGVTVAKEFAFETWTVKPSFDLSLQGNFGDDEIDSNNSWDGVANKTTQYSAEYLDNFTYGATVGVAAKTGSSNTDSFNATANARFVF